MNFLIENDQSKKKEKNKAFKKFDKVFAHS
jgi:hypothetical protein